MCVNWIFYSTTYLARKAIFVAKMSFSKPSCVKSCQKNGKSVSFNVRVKNCDIDREIFIVKNYVEVFVNDEEFSDNERNKLMIVDIGCPRSLMGKKEYRKMLNSLSSSELARIREFKTCEKFRFGPSRVYESWLRVEMPMDLEGVTIDASFFVVDGDVPILIGNDLLEPLGAIIYTETCVLEFSKLGEEINMKKTRGGHFVIPIKNLNNDMKEDPLETEKKQQTRKISWR